MCFLFFFCDLAGLTLECRGRLLVHRSKKNQGFYSVLFICVPPVSERWVGGALSLGRTLNNCQRWSQCHLSCCYPPPPLTGSVTVGEAGAGAAGPTIEPTHLVPADAFTALRHDWPSGCAAEHQNINMAQTGPGPWDYLQGKQRGLLSLWRMENNCRQGDQCKQKDALQQQSSTLIHSVGVVGASDEVALERIISSFGLLSEWDRDESIQGLAVVKQEVTSTNT